MPRLIDTHAHLDEVDGVDSVLETARGAGVIAVVAVGSDWQSNTRILEISRRHSSFVHPALGLHPWRLAGLKPSEINENLRFIEQNIASAVAVGEIGLDYDKRLVKMASKELQREVLGRLLELAREYDRPAIVHSRYAWKDCFDLVVNAGTGKAVFHWFTGFSSVLRDIIGSGYFISATPAVEYHEEHRRAVREAPLGRLLLETDSPATYGRGTRYQAEPADVVRSLKTTARLKEVDEAAVAEQTTKNASILFSLDQTLKTVGG